MPFDRRRYPPEWPTIRQRILERAGNRCERCGVPNHVFVRRNPDGSWKEYKDMGIEVAGRDGVKLTKIVLTIAHVLNPDPMDVRDENLQALCQWDHNRLDAPLRQRHAAETRRRKKIAAGQAPIEGVR